MRSLSMVMLGREIRRLFCIKMARKSDYWKEGELKLNPTKILLKIKSAIKKEPMILDLAFISIFAMGVLAGARASYLHYGEATSLAVPTSKYLAEISRLNRAQSPRENSPLKVIMETPWSRDCKIISVLDKNRGRGKLIRKIANDFELTQAEAKSKLDSAEKNECNDDYQNFKANLFRQKVNPYFKYLGFNYLALLEGEQALLLDSEKLSWSWKNVKAKPTFP
jgi:hypothetical protein